MCFLLYNLGVSIGGGLIATGITAILTYCVVRPKVVHIKGELHEMNHERFMKLIDKNMSNGFYLDIFLEDNLAEQLREHKMLFFTDLELNFSQCTYYSTIDMRMSSKKINGCFCCDCIGPQMGIMTYRFIELPKIFFDDRYKRVVKRI